MKDYKDLSAFAKAYGFTVTSAKSGKHNSGSKHYRGLVIDVRTRDKTDGEIEEFTKICRAKNLRVLDERQRPNRQKIWNGTHLHIEI